MIVNLTIKNGPESRNEWQRENCDKCANLNCTMQKHMLRVESQTTLDNVNGLGFKSMIGCTNPGGQKVKIELPIRCLSKKDLPCKAQQA